MKIKHEHMVEGLGYGLQLPVRVYRGDVVEVLHRMGTALLVKLGATMFWIESSELED